MDFFDPGTFGKLNAETYDDAQTPAHPTEDCVAGLAALAEEIGGTRLLEFAIGTGRVAIPLAERGFAIEGIEASPEMVEKMRAKPGGADIPVTMGDMAEEGPGGPFDLAFLVFNTLFNLPDQDAQVRCFRNAARHLRPGGLFVVEAFVPDFSDFFEHQRTKSRFLTREGFMIDACHHDPRAQQLDFQRMRVTAEGHSLIPLTLRYAYPAELDLMAQLAGLRLAHRWSDWKRSPRTPDSADLVSVYAKPAP